MRKIIHTIDESKIEMSSSNHHCASNDAPSKNVMSSSNHDCASNDAGSKCGITFDYHILSECTGSRSERDQIKGTCKLDKILFADDGKNPEGPEARRRRSSRIDWCGYLMGITPTKSGGGHLVGHSSAVIVHAGHMLP